MLSTTPNKILNPPVRVITPDAITNNVTRLPPHNEKRRLLRLFRQENAKEFIGQLEAGMDLLGVTKGDFSFIHAIAAVSDQTGPGTLDLCCWTTGTDDTAELVRLADENRFVRCRFLLDLSLQRREPALLAAIRRRWGNDAVALSRVHAKFALFGTSTWKLVLLTSANLNDNRRIELFQLADDATLFGFFTDIMDQIFSKRERDQIHKTPGQLVQEFNQLSF